MESSIQAKGIKSDQNKAMAQSFYFVHYSYAGALETAKNSAENGVKKDRCAQKT